MIDRLNPQPLLSQVLDEVAKKLLVSLDKPQSDDATNEALRKYRRAANYIAAAMNSLEDKAYVKQDLKFDDIKPRLVGHLGTCPS